MFKKFLRGTALAALVLATSASAQDYPTKPISIVMPFSAGGPGDALARILAGALTNYLKKQVIVENIPGAGGTIGSGKVARSTPDGYTLLMTHISHAINPTLYRKLPYDTLKDFVPIGVVVELSSAMVARKDFPPANFKDFITYVKANKDKVTYAHAGLGSAAHLCGLLFMTAIDTDLTTVPYKGTGPAMNDLLGGQVDIMCDQVPNILSQVKAGKIKVYAVTSPRRIPQLPDVPTFQEGGLADFSLSNWYALYAPKGTPQPILDKIGAALQAVLKEPGVKEQFAKLGAEVVSPDQATPAALAAKVQSETDKWGPIIKKAGAFAD
jgi:tripartite-type tricarboxylate transporter receptor subunit TctC